MICLHPKYARIHMESLIVELIRLSRVPSQSIDLLGRVLQILPQLLKIPRNLGSPET